MREIAIGVWAILAIIIIIRWFAPSDTTPPACDAVCCVEDWEFKDWLFSTHTCRVDTVTDTVFVMEVPQKPKYKVIKPRWPIPMILPDDIWDDNEFKGIDSGDVISRIWDSILIDSLMSDTLVFQGGTDSLTWDCPHKAGE